MPRGLDHIVHVVRDLDVTGEFYRRAGFTVGARNRHPWGTHNRIIQFPGVFIELLAIGEPELITAASSGSFSFGGFARDFLAREEGLAMLVLEGRGAAADAKAFRAAGIGDFEVFDFEREGKRPDGTPVKVAFSLAFAADAKAPNVGYFTCQQHFPENFWNPAFQSHANGVSGVAGVIFVAPNPAEHRHFITSFSGVDDFSSDAGGIVVQTPRGTIEVMTPSAYRVRTGTEPPDTARGARLAAVQLAVQDQSRAKSAIRGGGIASSAHDGGLVIPAGEAHGATLIFGGKQG